MKKYIVAILAGTFFVVSAYAAKPVSAIEGVKVATHKGKKTTGKKKANKKTGGDMNNGGTTGAPAGGTEPAPSK